MVLFYELKKKLFLLSGLAGSFFSVQAQLVVNNTPPYNTPEYLVQGVLLGTGVSASNITFNGDNLQFGFFKSGSSSIGIDSGLVISTDEVLAFDLNNLSLIEQDFTAGLTSDLIQVANSVPTLIGQNFTVSSINDLAELEFDFVPASDTVVFNFVFGSDEYMDWVNTKFNDVFAFFISGPGITGPYESPSGFPNGAKNIGFIPNTSPEIPITVSSVNSYLNSAYYTNNPSNIGINVDGYTHKLQAKSAVTGGQTYHIRLAIADGSDQMLKSGVFFEAASFSTNYISGPSHYQVCESHPVALNVVVPVGSSVEWYDNALGTGSALSNNNPWLVSPSTTTHYYAFSNNGVTRSSALDVLVEVGRSFINETHVNPSCQNINNGAIYTVVSGGVEPYTYTWSNGCTNDSLTNVSSGNYLLTVTDALGCEVQSTFTLSAENNLDLNINTTPSVCVGQHITLSAITNNNVQYEWSTGENTSSITFIGIENTLVYITVTDANLCRQYDSVSIAVTPLPNINASHSSAVCSNQPVLFSANTNEPCVISWSTGAEGSHTQIAIDQIPDSIWVFAQNNLGCIDSALLIPTSVAVYSNPESSLDTLSTHLLNGDVIFQQSHSSDVTAWSWDFGDGDLSYDENPTHHYANTGDYSVTLVVRNEFNCLDTSIINIHVEKSSVLQNVFSPNADGINDVFRLTTIEHSSLVIFNRWGKVVFETEGTLLEWDGKTKTGEYVSTGSYYYTLASIGDSSLQNGYLTVMK